VSAPHSREISWRFCRPLILLRATENNLNSRISKQFIGGHKELSRYQACSVKPAWVPSLEGQ